MKLVISFLFSFNALAAPIHLYYEVDPTDANMFRDILMMDYKIPEELITVKMTVECESTKGEGKLDLCLKNNGDLIVVSVDRSFINESLKIFQAP